MSPSKSSKSTLQDTVAYGLLGSDSIIKIHSRTGGVNKVLVQETSFPATISCIALAPGLVITCAYQVHHTQFGPQYVVTIWDRETGSVMSTFRPHEDIIRGVVMVTDKFLVTASNDQTLAVTDLLQPSRPKHVAYLRGHLGSISGMDTDHRDRLVSICSGQELRVWSLNKTRCLMTMTTPGLCLRVKIWDKYVAAGGQDKIWIWNLTRGEVVRYLGIRNNGILNVLGGMTGGHIVAGDHLGVLSVWSMESLLEGEGDGVVYPHRSLNVEGGPGHEFLSGLVVEENSVVTAGWGGRVIVWNFL